MEGIPFCLATNSALANAEECLQSSGLAGVFPAIIARDHVESGKPAPDIFLKAAAVLDIPIERCMVLEDSSTGIEAASKAGALPVLVSSALPVDKTTILRCQLVFNDLLELLDFIQG
jgi:beta-phosphoglucomutase-like phosphatase (HAD superfamily)